MKMYNEKNNKNRMNFRDVIEEAALKLAHKSVNKCCVGFVYEPKLPASLLARRK
ncbi:cyclic lactone autoinducer peptide [Listeria rocourtiae]|uniref:cyclic lactone autoinducer peptide n=1 Tax=Listeria rocourtiae TaxID=647910 RepID=UPI003D2F8A02